MIGAMTDDPKTPLLDPQTLRVVLVGSLLLVVLLGLDAALELAGHGDSPIAILLTKLLVAVVGIATTYLAGRGPGPEQGLLKQRIAQLERRTVDTVPPKAPPTG